MQSRVSFCLHTVKCQNSSIWIIQFNKYSFNVKNCSISNNFSISTQFSSFWPIDKTQSDATTPCYSGPGGEGGEGSVW